jgi:drug/metabolite transporter (DMT)-like permease
MFGYAFMLIAGKNVLRQYSVWTMLVFALGFAALAWAVVNPPWVFASMNLTLSDWGILLLFALISILIPHSAFAMSLKLLDATTVGIASALEPVVAIGTAALALGEPITLPQLIGGMGILLSVLLLQLNQSTINLLFRRQTHEK